MFEGDSNLTAIYVGKQWSTSSLLESVSVFSNCTNLVGCKGTVYDEIHTDASYARIDGGAGTPGYLTLKQ